MRDAQQVIASGMHFGSLHSICKFFVSIACSLRTSFMPFGMLGNSG